MWFLIDVYIMRLYNRSIHIKGYKMTKLRWHSGDLQNLFFRCNPLKPDWQRQFENMGFKKDKVFGIRDPFCVFARKDGAVLTANIDRGRLAAADLYVVWQPHDQNHPPEAHGKFDGGMVDSPDGLVTYAWHGRFFSVEDLNECMESLMSKGKFKFLGPHMHDAILKRCLVSSLDWFKVQRTFPEAGMMDVWGQKIDDLQNTRLQNLHGWVQDMTQPD
jgi:hypothetical protein